MAVIWTILIFLNFPIFAIFTYLFCNLDHCVYFHLAFTVLKNVSELNKRVLMVLMESHMQTIALQFLFQGYLKLQQAHLPA